jgi:hypothetical protein
MKPKLRGHPSAKGQFKSTLAKKRASRDKVKNTKAKARLSKPHPKTPTFGVRLRY